MPLKISLINPLNNINSRRQADIRNQSKNPVLNVFEDQLNWGSFFSENYYEGHSFTMERSGLSCKGIEELCRHYYDKKLIIKAPTGYGKSTALKKLYLDLNGIDGYSFYYVQASFFKAKKPLKLYEDIKNALVSQRRIDGLFLIDGFEEAFTDDPVGATKALMTIVQSQQRVWIACRPEFFDRINSTIRKSFDDVAVIDPWTATEFENLIRRYENKDGYHIVADRVRTLASNFASGDRSNIIYCPLYATMLFFIAKEEHNVPLESPIYDEYLLLDKFIDLWFRRELKGTSNKEEHLYNLRQIIMSIYKGVDCTTDDSVIRAFLFIPGSTIIRGFYHKELLVYFIVDAMLQAALNTPEKIIYWFSQTFYYDITNMLKLALRHLNNRDRLVIYNNLFSIYRACYEESDATELILKEVNAKHVRISMLKLKDELLYCIMRLGVDLKDFLLFASNHIDHPIIELGLAYGMANLAQHPLTLQFARKLHPGTVEDYIQRGWALCYHGDCNEDGYTYEDDSKINWVKVRNVKLARVKRNDPIAYRYRLLDIPLLYCFFYSRKFKDCINYTDFYTIQNCDIAYDGYSPDEAQFLIEQKNQLVEKYKAYLLKWYHNQCQEHNGRYHKGDSSMNESMLLQELAIQTTVNENLYDFWEKKGLRILDAYSSKLTVPEGANTTEDLDSKLTKCKVLILTANYVEGVTVTNCLMLWNGGGPLERVLEDDHIYQFATVFGINIVHIWPRGTASFTTHGSFNALTAALRRFTPTFVFAVGVAFGANPDEQKLGDVLVSSHLVFYDSFNKLTDGNLTLSPDEVQEVGSSILNGCRFLDDEEADGPTRYMLNGKPLGEFGWFKGALLTGGTVLSDAHEKRLLMEASKAMGREIIGGEMEGSGVYFACNGADKSIPFVIVKGICDWGVNKNGWLFVAEKQADNKRTQKAIQKRIKDCVQAYACENALITTMYMLVQFGNLVDPNLHDQ